MNSIILAISRDGTLRPLDIWCRPSTSSVHDGVVQLWVVFFNDDPFVVTTL